MRSATILGFPVVVNPTWLLVFGILIVSLVTSFVGTGPARLAGVQTLGISALVVALFLASIVAHELTHALVARRRGLPERPVQLLTIGRPVEAEPDPTSPLTAVLVAASGPLVSAAIGTVLVLIAAAFPSETDGPIGLLYWTIYWLGLANLALAILHLVPVLPLDGGRLVQAVGWRISGDLERGTTWASAVGRAAGYAIIGSGLYIAFSVEVFIGIWLVLMGWFAGRLSKSAVDHRRIEKLTAGLTVTDATDTEPATVPPSLSIETLMAQDAQDGGSGVYPVFDGQHLLGIVFLSRLRRPFRRGNDDRRAADVLVPIERAVSLRPDEPLMRAVERLERTRADGVPVVEPDAMGGSPSLVGIVTRDRVMTRLRARQALGRERGRSAPGGARG